MEITEKLLNLRKANGLTQEQLAEQLGVSRQSVSKWESGQAMPELDKIVSICEIFHVTADYLLKPSDMDILSVKTEMLEKQQKSLEHTIHKKEVKRSIILGCVSIYLIAFAIIMLIERITWENDFLWNIFPGVTLHIIVLCVATAVAIIFYIKSDRA